MLRRLGQEFVIHECMVGLITIISRIFVFVCMHVCACKLSHIWLFCNTMDCRPPGPSVYGISQARILEWVDISFSRRSFWSQDRSHITCGSCFSGGYFTTESPGKPHVRLGCVYVYAGIHVSKKWLFTHAHSNIFLLLSNFHKYLHQLVFQLAGYTRDYFTVWVNVRILYSTQDQLQIPILDNFGPYVEQWKEHRLGLGKSSISAQTPHFSICRILFPSDLGTIRFIINISAVLKCISSYISRKVL